MELILVALASLTLIILIVLFIRTAHGYKSKESLQLIRKAEQLERDLQRQEQLFRDEFRANREEMANSLNSFQENFLKTLREISANQLSQLKIITDQNESSLGKLTKTMEERLTLIMDKQQQASRDMRDSLDRNLKDFRDSFSQNVKDFNELQKQKFTEMEKKQSELINSTEMKLEKMRETVDEKLQKTLEARLGHSFELVRKQLESVQKGLGEMQNLAQDVGGLKRVLANVKTRGILGEIQLGSILSQIMAPEQYEQNVRTKKSSSDHVEYAIKLPGKDNSMEEVYLPIDAKFPLESYHQLQHAYDEANPALIDEANKILFNQIKKFAKDISDKYLDPPFTTEFGIMFLPVEGLYAEVVRNTDLIEQMQRDFKIVITGPTTLAAILNSLQMGFKTLAIQKRSSEVWKILGAVKTEFGKFGTILEKARKKIDDAGNEIDTLVGTRTRAIERKLREVEELPVSETMKLLDEDLSDTDDENN
ncbi:MAG: DNA recombination protein RmuC [Bacteroidales bacterium]|nr:DNA recombination protein RmuC [Bacteroidales bacterium]